MSVSLRLGQDSVSNGSSPSGCGAAPPPPPCTGIQRQRGSGTLLHGLIVIFCELSNRMHTGVDQGLWIPKIFFQQHAENLRGMCFAFRNHGIQNAVGEPSPLPQPHPRPAFGKVGITPPPIGISPMTEPWTRPWNPSPADGESGRRRD